MTLGNLDSFSSHLRWCGPLQLAFMGNVTYAKWQKKKKVTLHILTHGAMQGCVLTSLVAYIHDKIRDIRERNARTRSEILTANIRTLVLGY